MDFINNIANDYNGLIQLLSASIGLGGFCFGLRRYFREKMARKALDQNRRELEAALTRLRQVDEYANGLDKYRGAA